MVFADDKIQALGTLVQKEHQSSSIKGRSRSSTLQLAAISKDDEQGKKPARKYGRAEGQVNKQQCKRRSCRDDACGFSFNIFCASNEKWYIAGRVEKTASTTHHSNHLPLDAAHILTQKNDLTINMHGKINILLDSGATNSVIVSVMKKECNVTLSHDQIRSFKDERVKSLIANHPNEKVCRSSVDRLICLVKNMDNVSYIYVMHNTTSGFVSYHRTRDERIELLNAKADLEAWRKQLQVDESEEILVAFAWCHDAEKRNMVMFPEYLAIDMTFGLNRERRNLVTIVGVDGHMKLFTGLRCWMPSKQTVAYEWAIGEALPTLIGKNVTMQNRVISSDGELALNNAVMASISKPNGPFACTRFRKDYYHLFRQNWNDIVAVCKYNSPQFDQISQHIMNWIKSWFDYVQTEKEYNLSNQKLEDYIANQQGTFGLFFGHVKQIIKSVHKDIQFAGNHYFLTTTTLGFLGSSIVEAANPGIKWGTHGVNTNMSLDNSTLQQMKQVDHGIQRKNVNMARNMNKSAEWTRSLTSDYLTQYMEGLAAKNFDLRKIYGVCYIGDREWWVMRLQIMTNLNSNEKSSSETQNAHQYQFDRVYTVNADVEDFITCSCGYVHNYMAPCRHVMAVLGDVKYIVPSLFHIRWWKQFNYYFGTQFGISLVKEMHVSLAKVKNVMNEKSFDKNGSFRGCCLAGTDFFDVPRQSNKNSSIFKVMQAVKCYIQQDGPLPRNDKAFAQYLSCFGSSNSASNSSLNCNVEVQRYDGSDDETGGFEFDNMNQFAGGTKEVGFLSQGSALLEGYVNEQSVSTASGGDLFNRVQAFMNTIRSQDQCERFEDFLRNEHGRNIMENNDYKTSDGTIMYGADISGPIESGKRRKYNHEKSNKFK